LIAARLIGLLGPAGLFWFIGVAHLVLIVFTLYRMTRRQAATATPYRYVPRTSMVQQRFWKRRSNGAKTDNSEGENS
ncbi:MAG: hypothetical protein AAFN51_09660, partial [Pseudomonadota bacterium]